MTASEKILYMKHAYELARKKAYNELTDVISTKTEMRLLKTIERYTHMISELEETKS